MADGPAFESPVVQSYPVSPADLTLRDASPFAKWIVRAEPESSAAGQLGVGFGASRSAGDAVVLGSRPDEWMVVGSPSAVAAVIAGLDRTGFVSTIDWTHGRALFRLMGAAAASLLEKVCSLDWSDDMTPDGAVASASVAKVTCDIARNDQNGVRSYLLACDRSVGQYLFDALLDAGAEFGIGVAD